MCPYEFVMSDGDEIINTEATEWMRFGMRLGIGAALHPFEYSKVLIQLGYEPIPPTPGRTILGRPTLMLPNIIQYVGHIRKVDGFYGCYRGLAPKIVGSICSMVVSEKLSDHFGIYPLDDRKDDDDITKEELYLQFKVNLKHDIVLSVTGIIVSQPFHVISIRMMAQFVGRETLYKSIIGSMIEIYKQDGIFGFFSGIIPKLLGEMACLVLTSSTVYMLNKYIIKDKIGRQYGAGFIQFVYSSLLYPLNVVATCMSVTGSRLIAGQMPFMPLYRNWIDCFYDLQTKGDLKRGNSVFWRTTKNYNMPLDRHTMNGKISNLSKYY